MDSEIDPFAEEWEESGSVPKEAILKVAKMGCLALSTGNPWPSKYYPDRKVCGEILDKTDTFHEAILYEELSRPACGGVFWALIVGTCIGLPPIMKFGSESLKEKFGKTCLRGEKLTCLAVTEPWVGSDVANMRTTAVKTPCGKFYIVNGMIYMYI